jgi:hypothetical protein
MSEGAVLTGKRVAMLVEDEFEDRELTGPLEALRSAGVTVTIVGPTAGAEFHGKRGQAVVTSDLAAGAARMKDFEAGASAVQSRVRSESRNAGRFVAEAVQATLAALNIPSRKEVAELTRKVDTLSKKIDKLRKK